MKIAAVVVTYNRKELLLECIKALMEQSYSVDEIVVFDNASTDGTELLLREKGILDESKIKYVRWDENTGGAGGFYYGSLHAYKGGADWIWMMDDDCIPTKTALEKLMDATDIVDAGFLGSAVNNALGDYCNRPGINPYSTWYKYAEYGLVEIVRATFVSFLVSRKTIEKCGLPYKGFFIWGDDDEYCRRIITTGKAGYLVSASKVIHKVGNNVSPWDSDVSKRIKMARYLVRNALLNAREYGRLKGRVMTRIGFARLAFHIVFSKRKKKLQKLWQIVRGFAEYHFGTYDRKAFRNRFTNHLDGADKKVKIIT